MIISIIPLYKQPESIIKPTIQNNPMDLSNFVEEMYPLGKD